MIPPGWSEAGLTDLEGRFGRPVAAGRWVVPSGIELQGDQLIWREFPARQVSAGPKLLEEFVRLADRPAEAVLSYARRWGVLGICEHGLPLSHNPPPTPLGPGSFPMTWCRPLAAESGVFREPLDAWWRYSRQYRAVLNLAACLHDGRLGQPEDWKVLFYKESEERAVPWWRRRMDAEWSVLSFVVNEWLDIARVRIRHVFERGKHDLPMSGMALFGALALQLLLAATRTDGLAICSACGLSYRPSRQPTTNRRRYCAECRERGASLRDAAADYRRRKQG